MAIQVAASAAQAGEVPVGALVVKGGQLVSVSGNQVMGGNNVLAHAELLVIQAALQKLNSRYLEDCDIYVTLEPCAMCAGAISLARLRRLYFGAYDPKGGAIEHGACVFAHPTCHHHPQVIGGIQECACQHLMQSFFQNLRELP